MWEEPWAWKRSLPGRPVSDELCKPDWYQQDGLVVQWFCVLFTHSFTHLRFGAVWCDELPPMNLLAPNGNTFPLAPKALALTLCAFWLINHQGMIARVTFTFVYLV